MPIIVVTTSAVLKGPSILLQKPLANSGDPISQRTHMKCTFPNVCFPNRSFQSKGTMKK